MKKLLLSLTVIGSAFIAQSQVVVAGVSPASIQGNYEFGTQANCGTWPGETDDGTWNTLSVHNFNNAGEYIQAELELGEDGTPGTNAQGNPISQEGCAATGLTNSVANGNDLTGKIAVLYRNTCNFSLKALNAQNAGAIALLCINRLDDAAIGMTAGPDGVNVTIPMVIISSTNGALLVNEMQNGPVTMFIGNILGAFTNDLGAVKGEFLVPPYGGVHKDLFTGFDPGIQLYNYGTADYTDVIVNATITGPTGIVYNEDIGPLTMNGFADDTVSIFPGNGALGGFEFPPYVYNAITDIDGDYTLVYDIYSQSNADDNIGNNTYTVEYKVQGNTISLARLDASDMPIVKSYPSNADVQYRACTYVSDPNASALGVQGVYLSAHADTSINQFEGEEILVNVYQWSDGWVDTDDAAYDFGAFVDPASATYPYAAVDLIQTATYLPASDDDVDDVVYQPITPFVMQDDVRYLFCLETYNPSVVSFGYDNATDYSTNASIFAQPVSPIFIADTDPANALPSTWYLAGWSGVSANAIGLKTFAANELGVVTNELLAGKAYPNPATNVVTIAIAGEGSANLSITDISGKTAMTDVVILVNGTANVNIDSLESGVYIFNVTLENGQASQFSVVKK